MICGECRIASQKFLYSIRNQLCTSLQRKKVKILIFLLLVLFIAVVWDFRKGKIPNILILCGVSIGIFRLICYHNIATILTYLPGILLPLILLFPLYKIGTLGAGDIKLFCLLGFYFSFMEMIFCIFSAFFIGAAIALFILLWKQNLRERFYYLFYYLKGCISSGHIQYYYQNWKQEDKVSKIHFSLPIFLSAAFLFYILGNELSKYIK